VPGTKFAGNRYIKDNDPAVMLLYDVNGYIAGIQAGVSSSDLYFHNKSWFLVSKLLVEFKCTVSSFK